MINAEPKKENPQILDRLIFLKALYCYEDEVIGFEKEGFFRIYKKHNKFVVTNEIVKVF